MMHYFDIKRYPRERGRQYIHYLGEPLFEEIRYILSYRTTVCLKQYSLFHFFIPIPCLMKIFELTNKIEN